jgi:hypothetical protein
MNSFIGEDITSFSNGQLSADEIAGGTVLIGPKGDLVERRLSTQSGRSPMSAFGQLRSNRQCAVAADSRRSPPSLRHIRQACARRLQVQFKI